MFSLQALPRIIFVDDETDKDTDSSDLESPQEEYSSSNEGTFSILRQLKGASDEWFSCDNDTSDEGSKAETKAEPTDHSSTSEGSQDKTLTSTEAEPTDQSSTSEGSQDKTLTSTVLQSFPATEDHVTRVPCKREPLSEPTTSGKKAKVESTQSAQTSPSNFQELNCDGGSDTKRKREENTDEDDEGGDEDDDPEASQAFTGVEVKKKRRRVRKANVFQRAKPPPEVIWREGQPTAILHTSDGQNLNTDTLKVFMNAEDFEEKCSEHYSRVVNPKDKDMLFYADVDEKKILDMALTDGLCWRFKTKNKVHQPYIIYNVFAETEIPMMYSNKLRKFMAYEPESRKMVVLYTGDPRYAFRHPWTSEHVDEIEKPPLENLLVHPNEVVGQNETRMTKYLQIWHDVPDHRRARPDVALGKQAAPPPTQEEVLAGSQQRDVYFVDPQMYRTERKRPKKVRVFDDSDEENAPADTASDTEEQNYDQAHSNYTLEKAIRRTLQNILAIKAHGDDCHAKWEAETRGPFYESVVTTSITYPQPNQVYFRDLKIPEGVKKPFWNFEEKEAKDGYTWRRRDANFMGEQWANIFQVTYINYDTQRNQFNPEWKKYMYIFPKEDKMIIIYRGNNTGAAVAPRRLKRYPEVKEKAYSALDEKDMTGNELFQSQTATSGPGMAGVLSQMRNTRQAKYIKKTYEDLYTSTTIDEMFNCHLADEIAGGNITRRVEMFKEGEHFMTLIDDAMIKEFQYIVKHYKGGKRLKLHMDTSFNAAGDGSGYLITHLLMEHPFITRASSGENESGVNLPLAALVHQRRTKATHHELLDKAEDLFKFGKVPSGTTLISDREFGDHVRVWENCKKVICWNHLKENIKREARHVFNVRGKEEIQAVVNNFHRLLRSHNEEEYIERRDELFNQADVGHEIWKNVAFQDYYMTSLDSDVRNYAGRWKLEEADIENAHQGITNNRAESMNAVFNKHKEIKKKGALPDVLLTYKSVVNDIEKEVTKAYFHEGDMRLKSEWAKLGKPIETLPAMNFQSAEEMRKLLKEHRAYKGKRDPAKPSPPKTNSDRIYDAMVNKVRDEIEWYLKPENVSSFRFDPFDFTFKIAAFGKRDLAKCRPGEFFLTSLSPASCTCPDGPLCSHVYFLREKHKLPVSMTEMYRGQEKLHKARKAGKTKPDFGSKTPARGAYKDPSLTGPGSKLPSIFGTPKKHPSLARLAAEGNTMSPSLGHSTASTPAIVTSDSDEAVGPSTRKLVKFNFSPSAVPPSDEDDVMIVGEGGRKKLTFADIAGPVRTVLRPLPQNTDITKRPPRYYNEYELNVPTALLDQDQIDLDTAINVQHSMDPLGLGFNDAIWIVHSGKKIGLVKITSGGDSLVLYDTKYARRALDFSYIGASMNKNKASIHEDGQFCAVVGLREKGKGKDKEPFLQAALQAIPCTTLRVGKDFSVIPMKCYCNTPEVSADHSKAIGTELFARCNCGDGVHEECIDEEKKNDIKANGLTCALCRAQAVTPGVDWSACRPPGEAGLIIKNTCPVDNFFTGLLFFEGLQNPNLIEYFPKDAAHDDLRDTMAFLRRKEFNKAQVKYYNECEKLNEEYFKDKEHIKMQKLASQRDKEIKKIEKQNADIEKKNAKAREHNERYPTKAPMTYEPEVPLPSRIIVGSPIPSLGQNDLYGDISDRVILKHISGFQFYHTASCDMPTCVHHNVRSDLSYLVQIGPVMNRRPGEEGRLENISDIDKLLEGTRSHCGGTCGGIQTAEAITVTKDNWALAFALDNLNADSMYQTKLDILNGKLPKTLEVKVHGSDEKRLYGLATVTMNHSRNHFVSLQYIAPEGEFVYYDGIGRKNQPRIRKVHRVDLFTTDRMLNSVHYFRLK